MSIDPDVGEGCVVGGVKQLCVLLRDLDQGLGLIEVVARVAVLLRKLQERRVEFSKPAVRFLLQLRAQSLEGGLIVALSSASRLSVSGSNGAPGSVFVRSTRSSSGSTKSSASSIVLRTASKAAVRSAAPPSPWSCGP